MAHTLLVALSELPLNVRCGSLVVLIEGFVLGHGIKFIISLFSLLSMTITSANKSFCIQVGPRISK